MNWKTSACHVGLHCRPQHTVLFIPTPAPLYFHVTSRDTRSKHLHDFASLNAGLGLIRLENVAIQIQPRLESIIASDPPQPMLGENPINFVFCIFVM